MRRPALLSLMRALNLWLPRVVYCAYPLLVVVLAFQRDPRLFRVLLVPAAVFGGVTVMRRIWDLPRPYEALEIEPLIPREKQGRSFPSRHTASAAVIALAFWYVQPALGAVIAVIAALIAVIRPLAGIHFPRDVLAGAGLALAVGAVGFWIL